MLETKENKINNIRLERLFISVAIMDLTDKFPNYNWESTTYCFFRFRPGVRE